MVRDLIFFWLYLEMSKPNQLNLLSTFNLLIHLFSDILHVQKAITRKMADIANNMMRASIFNQIGHKDSNSPNGKKKSSGLIHLSCSKGVMTCKISYSTDGFVCKISYLSRKCLSLCQKKTIELWLRKGERWSWINGFWKLSWQTSWKSWKQDAVRLTAVDLNRTSSI